MKAKSANSNDVCVYRGEVWTLVAQKPHQAFGASKLQCWSAGALAVDNAGYIVAVGEAIDVLKQYPQALVRDFGDAVICPGFIDLHLHFPQTNMIGCFGEKLLGWLERYTFPLEQSFSEPLVAKKWSRIFMTELLANGTTTSVVFSSSHEEATDILFDEADRCGVRAVIGKVSMDRHAPDALLEGVEKDYFSHESLVSKWHGKDDRLYYALTPRFAPSCSDALMTSLGALKRKHHDLFVQTHFAESKEELIWVRELFPDDRDYLAVYERFGLIGPKTILAHAIHASQTEIQRMIDAGARIAHCPTSNLFLGSGLFPLEALVGNTAVGLGTDVGGGTSFSMWRTMDEAYKIQQLRGHSASPASLFHMATLAGAQALGMQDRIGSLEVGKQADFQVLDWQRNRLLRERLAGQLVECPSDRLFAMMHLADDRLVKEVFVRGKSVFKSTEERL